MIATSNIFLFKKPTNKTKKGKKKTKIVIFPSNKYTTLGWYVILIIGMR